MGKFKPDWLITLFDIFVNYSIDSVTSYRFCNVSIHADQFCLLKILIPHITAQSDDRNRRLNIAFHLSFQNIQYSQPFKKNVTDFFGAKNARAVIAQLFLLFWEAQHAQTIPQSYISLLQSHKLWKSVKKKTVNQKTALLE